MKALLASVSLAAMLAAPATAADIEFWYGMTGAGEQAIQSQCKAFNESQSDHTITCVGQGSYEISMQKAIAAVRANQQPTLIQFFDAGTLDLMLSGAVEPVAKALPDAQWDSYLTGVRSYYESAKGQLYSQPYNASTLILYGNKKLLAKAGIEKLPETYEQLAKDATKLKEAGVACPYATDAHPWRVMEQFAARHNLPIASKSNGFDGLDAEYVFNQGLVAQHMANLKEWRDQGILRLDPDTRAGKFADAFNAGECAIIENSTGGYGASYKALGDNVIVGMAPMYEGKSRYNTFVGGASIWIMKGYTDDELAAAKDFLNFVRLPEQQIAMTRTSGYLPVTNDVLVTMKGQGMLDDRAFAATELGVKSMDETSGDSSRGIRLGFFVQFRDVFREEMENAFNGRQPVQIALDNAKRRGDQLLRRFQQTYAGVELP